MRHQVSYVNKFYKARNLYGNKFYEARSFMWQQVLIDKFFL